MVATKRTKDISLPILIGVVVVIVVVIVIVPVAGVLTYALNEQGREVLTNMFTGPANRRVVSNTMLLGVVVSVIGTLIGAVLAYAQVRLPIRGKKILHLIALLPIVAPPFAVATAVIVLFGRNGIITNAIGLSPDIYGLPGLTIVLALSFYPVAYMNMKGVLESLDPRLDEAAANLGASQLRTFVKITVPAMLPGLGGSALLLFVETIADLANPLVIGGNFTVLSSRAYLAMNGEFNLGAAAAYSTTLIVPALLVFVVQRYWASRKVSSSIGGKPTSGRVIVRDKRIGIPFGTITYLLLAFVILIYVTVIVGGFVEILGVNNSTTTRHYTAIFNGNGFLAFKDTIRLAVIGAPIGALLGILIGWLVVHRVRRGKGTLDFLGMLGIAVPGTVLGIGYALAFSSPMTIGGVKLLPALTGGTSVFAGAIGIVMVFVASTAPLAQRIAISAAEQIDHSIDQAATALGASAFRTFVSVIFPLMMTAFRSSLISTFAKCMTLMSAVVFITSPRVRIVTQQVLNEVDSGRFGSAFAYCTLLIVVVLSVIGLIELSGTLLEWRRKRALNSDQA